MSDDVTCRNCGYTHPYVRGRCPRCGALVAAEDRPEPSGCVRFSVGCFLFPLGCLGSCVIASYIPGVDNFALILAMVGGVVLIALADKLIVSNWRRRVNRYREARSQDSVDSAVDVKESVDPGEKDQGPE